jgi:hypothetical protein
MLARPAQTAVGSRPSLTLFFLLVGAFLLTLGYHVVQFPFWLSAAIVAAMLLRCAIEYYRLPLPSSTFCGILALVLLLVIFVEYNTLLGRDAGTALTGGLLTIKFYELRGPRDVSLIIFSCFFVVMSVLLYSQVLELFIYCLIMMWVLTALLMRVHTGDLPEDHLVGMLGKSGVIYLQALPLGVFLLLAFPRYTGQLSFSMNEATLGVTDTVAPGTIAKLAKDESTAMYVRFLSKNAPTDTDSMYWRGMVLWKYADGAWTPGTDIAGAPEVHKTVESAPDTNLVAQEITVKAHNQPWLFALDAPIKKPTNSAESPNWGLLYNGHVIRMSFGKLNHLARYEVQSDPVPMEQDCGQHELDESMKLPNTDKDHISSRVVALAAKLHEGLSDTQEQEYVAAVQRYFRDQNFTYTATPGVQGPDWLPVFLLQTKAGFCEHFASAFAVLMRLQHIPARVVVGYRGADFNPYSQVYVVSQFYAHAWDEIWVPSDNQPPATSKRGRWIRIDPTAPVSMSGQLPTNGADEHDTLSSQVSKRNTDLMDEYLPPWVKDSVHEMQLRRDQVESSWDNLVLSYDPETQFRLAQALGFGQKTPFALLGCCLLAAAICAGVFRKWVKRRVRVSPMEDLYAEFCHNMARRGIPRATWEGPLAYTGRVAEAFPDDAPSIQSVGSLVAHARYGPVAADAAAQEKLRALLVRLTASNAAARK